MLIVKSQSLDVYRNLAVEEYLMEQVVDMGPVLFLWRSDCAVVVGKNQNPWRECKLDLMRAEGVPLARRISGGGTVYHDLGNLNYCVIVDRTNYREQQAYDLICDTLKQFGINTERTGKSNLSVEGLKFSGNAFCFRRGRAMHHGTLLLHTDLVRLNRYLGSMIEGVETHAIASVPARVTNLELSLDPLCEALEGSFEKHYADGSVTRWTDIDPDPQVLSELVTCQKSGDWRYGATPRFSIEREGIRYEVVKGKVVGAGERGCNANVIEKDFSELAFSWVC